MAAALPAGVLFLRKTKQGLSRDSGLRKAGSSSVTGMENKGNVNFAKAGGG